MNQEGTYIIEKKLIFPKTAMRDVFTVIYDTTLCYLKKTIKKTSK